METLQDGSTDLLSNYQWLNWSALVFSIAKCNHSYICAVTQHTPPFLLVQAFLLRSIQEVASGAKRFMMQFGM